ncbi:MAG: hypothetical protein P3W96_006255 [Halomonas sp.]|nr:hypothetical protein [Halomonas sp.]MDM7481604.1 hypothetical protein [Halomonas sp.]
MHKQTASFQRVLKHKSHGNISDCITASTVWHLTHQKKLRLFLPAGSSKSAARTAASTSKLALSSNERKISANTSTAKPPLDFAGVGMAACGFFFKKKTASEFKRLAKMRELD